MGRGRRNLIRRWDMANIVFRNDDPTRVGMIAHALVENRATGFQQIFTAQSTPNAHAEIVLLNQLAVSLANWGRFVKITIYLHNSPCRQCTPQLQALCAAVSAAVLAGNPGTVYFVFAYAQVYRVRPPEPQATWMWADDQSANAAYAGVAIAAGQATTVTRRRTDGTIEERQYGAISFQEDDLPRTGFASRWRLQPYVYNPGDFPPLTANGGGGGSSGGGFGSGAMPGGGLQGLQLGQG